MLVEWNPKDDSMSRFELEIPGKYIRKFDTLDEAVRWSSKMMVNEVPKAFIYESNGDDRGRIVVRAEKKVRICPSCLQENELIHYSGVMARYNRLAICQLCEKEFRY